MRTDLGRNLMARLEESGRQRVGNAWGGALGFFLAHAARLRHEPLLVVTPDLARADALRLDLETFLGAPPLWWPPAPEVAAEARSNPDVALARARLLCALNQSPAGVVAVTTLAALVQPAPAPSVLDAAQLRVTPGREISPLALAEHLAGAGVLRVEAVEEPGQMAIRGGILDVWTFGSTAPVRLDFLGDTLESVHDLDVTTQRSRGARAGAALLALPPEQWLGSRPVEGASLLLDHVPASSPVALVGAGALASVAGRLREQGSLGARKVLQRVETDLARRPGWLLDEAPVAPGQGWNLPAGSLDALRALALRRLDRGEGADDRARRTASAFSDLAVRHALVIVYRRARGEEERLKELLAGHDVAGRIQFAPGSLSRSFLWHDTDTAHVAWDEVIDLPLRERRRRGHAGRSRPIEDFLDLEVGGLAVHLDHGIAIYRGLSVLDRKGGAGEYLTLEFAEGTTLYVPVHQIAQVQRYVGTGRRPKLSLLRGTDWVRRRKAVSAALEALAADLLAVQARRVRRSRAASPPDGEWQEEFESAFPFPDTPDQIAAVSAIKADLEGDRPMDRLLCGDVGYGKTEVALRAVFKVLAAGRQAAVLVPTRILAQQHARTFRQRLAPYPLRVALLTGLQSPAETRAALQNLRLGRVDCVVGTHRLLSRDVAFCDLGLVVVDEEQRFGVVHKERLKALRSEVDVLSLSATPIPRTLHMALLGLRDISNLATAPLGRHAIHTVVAHETDEILKGAVRQEIARGGQVFVVNSRIADLAPLADRLSRQVPEARISAIHGRMDRDGVEKTMLGFLSGECDVLLATTIVESGLDIPNANTIIVRDADRYGLAELHQLRGRVGRSERHAHALFLLPAGRPIHSDAPERLRAIQEYSELGAGFRIAMRDLEIRGAGDLLGPQQSGHIHAVGYELYCRLLAEAVEKAKGSGGAPAPPALAALSLDLPGFLPEAYTGGRRQKFLLLRRLAAVTTLDALAPLEEEITERFGPLPSGLLSLLAGQRARIRFGQLGIRQIAMAPRDFPGLTLAGESAALQVVRRLVPSLRSLEPGLAFLPLGGVESRPLALLQAALALIDGAAPATPRSEASGVVS